MAFGAAGRATAQDKDNYKILSDYGNQQNRGEQLQLIGLRKYVSIRKYQQARSSGRTD